MSILTFTRPCRKNHCGFHHEKELKMKKNPSRLKSPSPKKSTFILIEK